MRKNWQEVAVSWYWKAQEAREWARRMYRRALRAERQRDEAISRSLRTERKLRHSGCKVELYKRERDLYQRAGVDWKQRAEAAKARLRELEKRVMIRPDGIPVFFVKDRETLLIKNMDDSQGIIVTPAAGIDAGIDK